ncbi:MAG TPA: DUF4116 domain-containing protein, partial [Oceanospirillales bacterium]|nr:DUF4116 domain-containing protein [Oceanospirillales bacterium]
LKNDPAIVLSAIKNKADSLKFASARLRKNKTIVLAAIRYYTYDNVLKYADKTLRRDINIIRKAVKVDNNALRFADISLNDEKKLVLELVRQKPSVCSNLYGFMDKHLQKNRALILRLMKTKGCTRLFYFLNKKLQHDKAFAQIGVQQDGNNLEYVGSLLQDDKALVMMAIKQNTSALNYASPRLKNDRSLVISVINKDTYALNNASKLLQKDRELLLLTATKHNNHALYAQATEADKARVLSAVKKQGDALKYVRDQFKKDKDIVLAAVKQDGYALQFADKSLQHDKQIVAAALQQRNKTSPQQKKLSKAQLLAAIKNNPDSVDFNDERFQTDKTLVLASINRKIDIPHYYDFVNLKQNLKTDKDVLIALIKNSLKQAAKTSNYDLFSLRKYLHYLGHPLQDKALMLQILKKQGLALEYASDAIKKDKNFVLAAIAQNGQALAFADKHFQQDKSTVLSAIKQSPEAFYFADKKLKTDPDIIKAALKGKNTLYYLYQLLDKKSAKQIIPRETWSPDSDFYTINKLKLQLNGLRDFYKKSGHYPPLIGFNKDKTKLAAILTLRPALNTQLAIWDTKTKRLLHTVILGEHWTTYNPPQFTPDNRRLVSLFFSDIGVIWNFAQHKKPMICSLGSSIIDLSNKSVLVHPVDWVDGLFDLDTCNVIALQRVMWTSNLVTMISHDEKILMLIKKGRLSKIEKDFLLYNPTDPASPYQFQDHSGNYHGKIIIRETN